MRGQPRKFKTAQEFQSKFDDYLQDCIEKERLANIAGFCVFADMDRQTYYNQKDYYFDTFKKIENALEDHTINAKIHHTFKIFYMKNKFNYRDRHEIDNQVSVNNYKELSIEELKKLANDT
jgi:hypothetical protein